LIARFGDRVLAEIKTADIEDFIADPKQPRVVNRQPDGLCRRPPLTVSSS
jgi:hypothetical protein